MAGVDERWTELEGRMHELKDLDGILSLLSWDEETYAPPRARGPRGQQTATLEAIRHQRLVDPRLGELIAELGREPSLPFERRRMLVRLERKRSLACRLPEALVKALAEARSQALLSWQEAKRDDRFVDFAPKLARVFALLREKADATGYETERYDALLDEYEPEMKAAKLRPVLEALRAGLVPLVEAILGSGKRPDRSFLTRGFDVEQQWQFTLRLLGDLGFDLVRGRQDRSTHPFTTPCSEDDVRLTTRLFADNPLSAIYSTIHEAGHGLYEQGFSADHHRSTLAEAPSMGIHESQSRLWENMIGRSRAFWRHYLPVLRGYFPTALAGVEVEAMYRAVNVVEATPIRVEADEVTYNLHILVRFELEQALLDGQLPVEELPGAWREKMRRYLGITPDSDAQGCLQDIHWPWGSVGYFPTYSLGNLYAAQLLSAYSRQHPAIWEDVAAGRHGPLLSWLRARIHQRGHLESAQATLREAVGRELEVGPFLDYLRVKYAELYDLRL